MSAIFDRFVKAGGVFLVLATAALCGCAVTTGAGSLAAPSAAGYAVCSGIHASRLPQREEVGRVCRPVTSLQLR